MTKRKTTLRSEVNRFRVPIVVKKQPGWQVGAEKLTDALRDLVRTGALDEEEVEGTVIVTRSKERC